MVFVPTWLVPYFRNAYWSWLKLPPHYATKTSDSAFVPVGEEMINSSGLFWIDVEEKRKIKKYKSSGKTYGPSDPIIDETYRVFFDKKK